MTIGIILLVIGIVVDIFIIKWEKKEAEIPFIPEWKFDENVTAADEARAVELLERYGKKDNISLPETFVIAKSVRAVIEHYSTLEFDDYTMDYTRKELLKGEETEECWKGFYCIGGDGGAMSFYVRKSTDDEKIYAFDMEGSSRPEPYASNIRRFIVMRHNAWQSMQRMIEEDAKAKRR